jgi:MFS transporter, DHA1 family, multidrug resistance protein
LKSWRLTAIGMMSFLPYFPTHLEALGMTDRNDIALWAGICYGAAPFSAALTSPLWGALGDRMGRKIMVVRSMLAITLFVGLMKWTTSPWELLILRILQGSLSGFAAPSLTLVSVSVPPEDQGRVAGSLQTAMAAGTVLGPVLGAALGPWIGYDNIFLVVAGLALVSAVLVMLWAQEDAAHRGEPQPWRGPTAAWQSLRVDLAATLQSPKLRASLAIVFFVQFGLGATNPILELHVRDLVVDPLQWPFWTSVLFSGSALLHMLAMPVWGKWGDRHGHAQALVLCAALSAVALFAHALAPVVLALVAARLVFGITMAASAPCSFGLAAAEVPVERRGGAFGIVFGVRTMSIAVSSIAGGWASAHIGIRGVFAVTGAVLLYSAWSMRRTLRAA